MILCIFWPFSGSEGSPRVPEGPQWFPMDILGCHEKSRWIILLWDYLTMGELGVSLTKGDQRNIWWFDAYFGRFLALKGPPRAPEGSQWFPMDNLVCHEKSRWIILLWDYLNYGRTGSFTNERWSKKCLIFCIFWPFSGSEGSPEGPWGSPMVPNGQSSVPWEVEMNYSTMGLFYFGRTGYFTNER